MTEYKSRNSLQIEPEESDPRPTENVPMNINEQDFASVDEGFLTRTNNTRRGVKLPPITPLAEMRSNQVAPGNNLVAPKDTSIQKLMNESAIEKCNYSSVMRVDDFKIDTIEISNSCIKEPEEPEKKNCLSMAKGCVNKISNVMSRLQFFKYAVGELGSHEPK
jgi:hypothetical protein